MPLSRNGSQKKWGKLFSWVSVYPDEFNLWPYRRMSAAAGMSYVRPFFFFFYSPLAVLNSICLSQICCSLICAENRFIGLYWKGGHGSLVGLAPGLGRCLWTSRSAEQQQQDWESWVGRWQCSKSSLSQKKIFSTHTPTLCTFLMLLFEKVGGIASNWLFKNAMKHLWAKHSL